MLPDFSLIVADESVDGRIIIALQEAGYTVVSIAGENSGIPDIQVIEIASVKNGFLITEDKDFGDELVYKKVNQVGSLFLRLQNIYVNERIRLIRKVLQTNSKKLQGAFSVLTFKRLRIRKYEN